MLDLAPELPAPGFNFDNCLRNMVLEKKGFCPPKTIKTGTTIVGVIYNNGVILGADTRATEDTIIADKNCEKIHRITDFIYCCGAGTAADTQQVTDKISSELALHELNLGRRARVTVANRRLKQMLFRYQGHISAALVLGGVDITGPHIYSIFPHGSTDKIPYATMGSGSLAAMAMFEEKWTPKMELEDAKLLVKDAISAGIFNDLGSGSNVDLCVITQNGAEYLRGYDKPNESLRRNEVELKYKYKPGTTAILSELSTKYDIEEEVIAGPSVEKMEE